MDQQEKDDLVVCMNLKNEGNQDDISVKIIFDLSKYQELNKVYKEIDLQRKEDEEEMNQWQSRLMPISEDDLLKVLASQPSMKELWKEVKKYDIDSNGFLTISELNSLFFQTYPELEGKSLFKIFRPFSSIQNKSIVDYKKFKEYLLARLETFTHGSRIQNTQTLIKKKNQSKLDAPLSPRKLDAQVSPREVMSPSAKRMEQIKDEILKAAQGSPEAENNHLAANRFGGMSSPNLKQKSTVEALVSPRSKKLLPQLDANGLKKTSGYKGRNLFSPGRASVGSKFSQYSTFSAPFFARSNDAIKQKLEYEWKNIYRSLNAIDLNSSGYVTKKEFAN